MEEPDGVAVDVLLVVAVPVSEAVGILVKEGVGVPIGVTELLAQRESVAVGVGEGVVDVVPVIVNDSVEVIVPEPVPEGVSVDVGVPDVDKLCVVVTVPVTLAVAPDARGTGELVGDGVPDGDCVADGVPVSEPEGELVGDGSAVPVPDELGAGVLHAVGVAVGVNDGDAPREIDAVGDKETADVDELVGVWAPEGVAAGVVDDDEVGDPVPVLAALAVPVCVLVTERDGVVDESGV